MRILKYFLFTLLGLVAAALIAALFVPKDMGLAQQVAIHRNADSVFQYVRLLSNQKHYNTWFQAEPSMLRSYQGADGTEGSVISWQGAKIGAGTQTITDIIENSRIESRLDIHKPFKSTAYSYILVVPNGPEDCEVSWGYSSHTPYPINILLPLWSIEKKTSVQLGQSLQNLKVILEKK